MVILFPAASKKAITAGRDTLSKDKVVPFFFGYGRFHVVLETNMKPRLSYTLELT